jgi:ribosome-binding protein aMBF1 (putative translation factor)
MRFEGRTWKDGKLWLAEVPLLDVLTQGRTQKEAYEMIRDAIEALVNRKGFSVEVIRGKRDDFEVYSKDIRTLVALMLKRQREANGLSLSEVAKKLRQNSKTAYARYEQGKSLPSVEKLMNLLTTVAPGKDIVFGLSD